MQIKYYRWPTNKPLSRQMVVIDDLGRYGIAIQEARHLEDGVLFARPVDVPAVYSPGKGNTGPILITHTAFHRDKSDGIYKGTWFDSGIVGQVREKDRRQLTIISDLGYKIPDDMADLLLSGSENLGHWNSFWAKHAGKQGGKSTSRAKAAAARANGCKGGRPRKKK